MAAIDVMLPYYGDVEQMKAAVRSVLAQSLTDWRLIVLDDGYPDPEPERWFSEITDSRVTYTKNDVNLGANGNYRKALEMVQAPYFVMMGADDVMLPNLLDEALTAFASIPEADVFQPGVQTIDEFSIRSHPLADRVKQWYAPKGSHLTILRSEDMAVSLIRADWAYFPSLVWKTETVKKYGFREGYDVVQDLGLLLDIAHGGGVMIYSPRLAFLYRRHSASDSSVRALDGRRFDEERRFFYWQASRFSKLGWTRAARAARIHLTSRLNAISLFPQAIKAGKPKYLLPLSKHVIR